MTRSFKFENVVCNNKRFAFTVKADSFSDAKKKAVNWCIKKLGLNDSDFEEKMDQLNKNIENGETRVIPIKNEKNIDFDQKFDRVYEELYSGLLKEYNETS